MMVGLPSGSSLICWMYLSRRLLSSCRLRLPDRVVGLLAGVLLPELSLELLVLPVAWWLEVVVCS